MQQYLLLQCLGSASLEAQSTYDLTNIPEVRDQEDQNTFYSGGWVTLLSVRHLDFKAKKEK